MGFGVNLPFHWMDTIFFIHKKLLNLCLLNEKPNQSKTQDIRHD